VAGSVSPSSQGSVTATCPSGTVPLGGGASFTRPFLGADLNSTFPTPAGWRTDLNNASASNGTFVAKVVCSQRPLRYRLVEGAPVANAAGTQAIADVTCPGRKVPLGGGARSSSASVSTNLNSSAPQAGGWTVFENNADAAAHTVTASVICAGR
jgi:hypothetical protein